MGRHARSIELTAAERDELERRGRARTSSQQAALRGSCCGPRRGRATPPSPPPWGSPADQVIHLILDPVKRHRSAEVAVDVASRPWRFQFHWLPLHGSWLAFIEVWFALLSKKCLDRGEWTSFDGAAAPILAFLATDNAHHAHPFTWRKGIKFDQRLKDKLAHQAASQPLAQAAA